MRGYKLLAPMLIAGFLVSGIFGCEREGPAERAGEEVDETTEEAGEAVEERGEEIQERTGQ